MKVRRNVIGAIFTVTRKPTHIQIETRISMAWKVWAVLSAESGPRRRRKYAKLLVHLGKENKSLGITKSLCLFIAFDARRGLAIQNILGVDCLHYVRAGVSR